MCAVTGSFFDSYPAGFATIDGSFTMSRGMAMLLTSMPEGLQEIDGGMYYAMADGSFLTNGAVGHLTFLAQMAVIPLATQFWTVMWIKR